MSEPETISNTASPCTRQTLASDLRQLGLTPGMTDGELGSWGSDS